MYQNDIINKECIHYVVSSSSIYGFWLALWYLQTSFHTFATVYSISSNWFLCKLYSIFRQFQWCNVYFSFIVCAYAWARAPNESYVLLLRNSLIEKSKKIYWLSPNEMLCQGVTYITMQVLLRLLAKWKWKWNIVSISSNCNVW